MKWSKKVDGKRVGKRPHSKIRQAKHSAMRTKQKLKGVKSNA